MGSIEAERWFQLRCRKAVVLERQMWAGSKGDAVVGMCGGTGAARRRSRSVACARALRLSLRPPVVPDLVVLRVLVSERRGPLQFLVPRATQRFHH